MKFDIEALSYKLSKYLVVVPRTVALERTRSVVPITHKEAYHLVSLLLKDLEGRMAARGLKLTVTDAARDEIIKEGSDPLFGARPLKRYIQSKVESLLARHIIASSPREGSTLTVDGENWSLV